MNPKAKGNREERKQARILSLWMFDDPDVLKRHATSGMDKSVYSGDIVPLKQINWNSFPFIIEIKTGYKDSIPTFYNYDKVESWYKKARIEGSKTGQYILLLICQFKNRQPLLITNQILNQVNFKVAFPVHFPEIEYAYVYDLKEVLQYPFREVFNMLNLITGESINHEFDEFDS